MATLIPHAEAATDSIYNKHRRGSTGTVIEAKRERKKKKACDYSACKIQPPPPSFFPSLLRTRSHSRRPSFYPTESHLVCCRMRDPAPVHRRRGRKRHSWRRHRRVNVLIIDFIGQKRRRRRRTRLLLVFLSLLLSQSAKRESCFLKRVCSNSSCCLWSRRWWNRIKLIEGFVVRLVSSLIRNYRAINVVFFLWWWKVIIESLFWAVFGTGPVYSAMLLKGIYGWLVG